MVAELTASSTLNRTLPSAYYYDPSIFEQEKERIFYDSWVASARIEEIPNPGDYILREIGDQSVIVVRTKSGEIKAFYNVCRHRGNRICSAERGRAKGSAFTCRYHGWTYNLDGELAATPNLAIPPSLNGEPLALYAVLQQPGGDAPAMRLAILSLLLAIVAIAASELLARRMRKQLGV